MRTPGTKAMKKFYSAATTLIFLVLTLPVFAQPDAVGTKEQPRAPARFICRLQAGEKITIATMGTSLTAGSWRWVDVLKEWLDQRWPGQVTVHNEGYGASASSNGPDGNTGFHQLSRVIAHRPDVVFIEFAINDAFLPYGISLEESQRNLDAFIDRIVAASPETEIILQTMNAAMDVAKKGLRGASDRPGLADYYEVYRTTARERGILLIDHYPNWLRIANEKGERFAGFVPDGIHPRLPAYREVLLPELKDRLLGGLAPAATVADFLASLDGSVRMMARRYEGSRLIEDLPFEGDGLVSDGGKWTCTLRSIPVAGESRGLELQCEFKLIEGSAVSAGVAIAFDFANWSPKNYVMIPAAVYNGNRCKIVDRQYAQGLDRKFLYEPDIPLMSVPIPHLSTEPGTPSKLEITACNAATPAICFFDPERKRAFILLAEQRTRFGDNGLAIEESADRSRATLIVSAPGVRERKPLFVGFTESADRGKEWHAGDSVTLRLRIYSFESPHIAGLLKKFMTLRKAVTGPNHPRLLVPFSQVAAWMTQRIDSRWHDGPVHKFYCPENAAWISFGWVGGLMNTFPMLALGDEMHRERVTRTFDFAIPAAQGESGYFYGALNHDGKCFSRDGYPEFPEIVLTRKNGDVLFWMVKQFMLLEAQDRKDAIKSEWTSNIRRLADAFVKTWKSHGQWGNKLNNQTGAVAEYNTSGGVMAIGGLALAARYFERPEYLDVAREAAEFYYERDVVGQGQTTGGCVDILQNADSETAFGFLTALMALHETTGEDGWLEKCKTLANLSATWTVSYDYALPPQTELARNGARLTGTVWASTQNKHGAPGICTSSGDPLFKLYRATGDLRYAELMRDIVRAHGESIRPDGYSNERLTYCDADAHSVGNRGNHVTGWCELNGFLMALEIPGIYVRTDMDRFYVFDHVEAHIVKRGDDGLQIRIKNPTKYDANVTILAENAEQAARPLGYTAFLFWPKFMVKSGEETVVQLKRETNGN